MTQRKKPTVELPSMRISYYYNDDIAPEPCKQFIDFMNAHSGMGTAMELDLYLNTNGGTLAEFNTIKSVIERSDLNITIFNSFEVNSYGFILFYTCERVSKVLLPNSTCLLHTVSALFEDRELRKKNDLYVRKKHELLDSCNREFLKMVKTNKILTAQDYKKLEDGEDIILLYEEFHKVMVKCPYGKFIYN